MREGGGRGEVRRGTTGREGGEREDVGERGKEMGERSGKRGGSGKERDFYQNR